MPRETPWEDEYTLLCERCGYVVEGLPTNANCPECGRPVFHSLHQRRPGTVYQNAPGARAAIATGWRTLTHPVRTLDEMRLGESETGNLAPAYSLWAGVLLVLSQCYYWIRLMLQETEPEPESLGATAVLLFGGVVLICFAAWVVAIAISALTAIETLGLRVISRHRRFRITSRIAYQITSHGSVGWAAGAGVGLFGFVVLDLVGLSLRSEALTVAAWIVLVCSMLAGFLFFETFAWLGLRRLKYANTPRPADESDGPVARAPGS